jgi:hypothetical protein
VGRNDRERKPLIRSKGLAMDMFEGDGGMEFSIHEFE